MRGVAVQIKRLKTVKATSRGDFLEAECNGGSDELALSGVRCQAHRGMSRRPESG